MTIGHERDELIFCLVYIALGHHVGLLTPGGEFIHDTMTELRICMNESPPFFLELGRGPDEIAVIGALSRWEGRLLEIERWVNSKKADRVGHSNGNDPWTRLDSPLSL